MALFRLVLFLLAFLAPANADFRVCLKLDYLENEEGKLMNLPLNPEATALWRATFTKEEYSFGYDDFVVGPAILIKAKALKRWAA